MKRSDFTFAAVVVGIAVLVFVGYFFVHGKEGIYVRVTVNGEVYAEYPLYEDRQVRLEYEEQEGFNKLVIEEGKASVISADCPDELCVKQKPISRTGESIVCLPHKLVITIIGGEEAEYDGIAG